MGKEIIIQLGMPKTATTTLQNRIYQNHDEYLYLGKFNPGYPPTVKGEAGWLLTFKRNLISKELPYFEQLDLEKVLSNEFGHQYEEHDKLFLSEESILGRCIGPGKYGDRVRVGSIFSIINKLKMLFDRSIFSSVKFILVLRKQDDLIESFFAEEYHNFRSFYGMRYPEDLIKYIYEKGRMEETDALFHYASVIEHLDVLFGEENVLVLPYELLTVDPGDFLNELSSFMGIKLWDDIQILSEKKDNSRDSRERRGKIAKVRPLRKKLSLLKKQLVGDVSTGFGSYLRFIDSLQKDKIIELGKSHKNEFLQYYSNENKKLEGRVKRISEFGYY